jgi:hypothetical protein
MRSARRVLAIDFDTWEQVLASGYVAWDEARDGPRVVIDMTDAGEGYRMAMRHLSN